MWQRFTERARRVVFFAQEEANRLGENFVSTEHLLLGLIRENDSTAASILDRMGISLGRIRAEVENQVSRGDEKLEQDMQLTPRAKRVIDLAYDEARNLNDDFIGTEHLLLGLIREGDGLAGRVLAALEVEYEAVTGILAEFRGPGSVQTPAAECATRVDHSVSARPDTKCELLPVRFSLKTKAVMQLAGGYAAIDGSEEINPVHLLLGLLQDGAEAETILSEFGLNLESVKKRIKTLQPKPDNTDIG